MLSEANEIAASIGFQVATMAEARETARRQLPGESEQMIDNVAWALWKPQTRYAEDLLPVQRATFTKVRVKWDFRRITDRQATAGAIGYIISDFPDSSEPTVLFEESSAPLVDSEYFGQCALRVDRFYLENLAYAM